MNNKSFALLSVLIASLFVCLSSVAESVDQSSTSPVRGVGLLITLALVYLTRRRAIGGWLFYFYFQLYASLLFSFVVGFTNGTFLYLNPGAWDDASLYVMYFLSLVPVLILQISEAAVATLLLFRRNLKNMKLLRTILLALAVASGIALWIDITRFEDELGAVFDGIGLAFALIWSAYFFLSRRVRVVFVENNWEFVSRAKRRALSPSDKKKLGVRAGWVAAATFLLLLLVMGTTLGSEGTKPDWGIFLVPFFWAAISALIAWNLPLRSRKVDGQN